MTELNREGQQSFAEVMRIKSEIKAIKNFLAEQLDAVDKYRDAVEKMREAKKVKKEVETLVYNTYASKLADIEDKKEELNQEKETLDFIVLKAAKNDEQLSFLDEHGKMYKPHLSTTFKKDAV